MLGRRGVKDSLLATQRLVQFLNLLCKLGDSFLFASLFGSVALFTQGRALFSDSRCLGLGVFFLLFGRGGARVGDFAKLTNACLVTLASQVSLVFKRATFTGRGRPVVFRPDFFLEKPYDRLKVIVVDVGQQLVLLHLWIVADVLHGLVEHVLAKAKRERGFTTGQHLAGHAALGHAWNA